MWGKSALLCALVLAACASPRSSWYLHDEGYSINPVQGDAYAVEIHVNQLKRLGGEIQSPEVRRFVFERLTWHEGCKGAWQMLPCVADGSCVQHTSRSVTILVRCAS